MKANQACLPSSSHREEDMIICSSFISLCSSNATNARSSLFNASGQSRGQMGNAYSMAILSSPLSTGRSMLEATNSQTSRDSETRSMKMQARRMLYEQKRQASVTSDQRTSARDGISEHLSDFSFPVTYSAEDRSAMTLLMSDREKAKDKLYDQKAFASAREESDVSHEPVQDKSGVFREIYFNYAPGNAEHHVHSNRIISARVHSAAAVPFFAKTVFCNPIYVMYMLGCVLQYAQEPSGYLWNLFLLVLVILLDSVLLALADKSRQELNHRKNCTNSRVLRNKSFQNCTWADIQTGDFVQVCESELVPADLLILAVARDQRGTEGRSCYADTQHLTGDTDPRECQALEYTMSKIYSATDLTLLRGIARCEESNAELTYTGKVEISAGQSSSTKTAAFTKENILLRGSKLLNVEYIYGLVIHVGCKTMVMRDTKRIPLKRSELTRWMENMLIALCVCMVVCCAVAAGTSTLWQMHRGLPWYLQLGSGVLTNFFVTMTQYFVLTYPILPLPFYVSMTIIRHMQSLHIRWDARLYDAKTQTSAKVQNMELNEELGQVTHIFMDKTGTLTQGDLVLRRCSINGISYGSESSQADLYARKSALGESKCSSKSSLGHDSSFLQSLYTKGSSPSSVDTVQRDKIQRFFEHIALCHTGFAVDGRLEEMAVSSSDDRVLVEAAAKAGVRFVARDDDHILLDVYGCEKSFKILHILYFTSHRRRMSVIVRRPNGDIYLYTKGADDAIFSRLRSSLSMEDRKRRTQSHIEQYARAGLRVLVLAVRKLEERSYHDWKRCFAEVVSNSRESGRRREGKSNCIDELIDELEQELDLIGATGAEDTLQPDVETCLTTFLSAGIQLYMLTGDKQETAVSTGYAAALLGPCSMEIILNARTCPDQASICSYLDSALNECQNRQARDQHISVALIIDGKTFMQALEGDRKSTLWKLIALSRVIICCRCSPTQKSQMIQFTREKDLSARTLAIGDGGNDIAMMQAAHVSISITNASEAVHYSDYSIAQFRFLLPLLFIHGRWNHSRMIKCVLYCLYKSLVLFFFEYTYNMYSGASGSPMYWGLGMSFFHIVTSLPIIIIGFMDQNVTATALLKIPERYRKSPLTLTSASSALVSAICDSMIILILVLCSYSLETEPRAQFEMLIFLSLCTMTHIQICFMATTWNVPLLISWPGSIFAFIMLAVMDRNSAVGEAFTSAKALLVFILICCLAVFRRCGWSLVSRKLFVAPDGVDRQTIYESNVRRISVPKLEEHTVSMSLDDVVNFCAPSPPFRVSCTDISPAVTPASIAQSRFPAARTGVAFMIDEEREAYYSSDNSNDHYA